jgi:serine/threonine protein kinase
MLAPTTTHDLLSLIRGSGVLDAPRLETFLSEQSTLPDSPRTLAADLIRAGLLTPFQAKNLLLGRSNGFVLGNYRILDRLGAGSGGDVFLAEHRTMCRRVAIKVLSPKAARDPAVVERFRREARAVARLDHRNIVRAYDIETAGPVHFLVMEFVDGINLQVVVERSGPLAPGRAVHYIRQAAEALCHVHETGLVHRDLKPSNLLLERSGTIKLADLGLVRFFHDKADQLTQMQGGSMMGTLDYLSPEQALDSHAVDIRTDIYSLGATLYFLLVGHPPFPDKTLSQKLLWVQMRDPVDLRELHPELSEGLAAVVRRMMAKDPAKRYQTAQEVVAALVPWEDKVSAAAELARSLPVVEPLPAHRPGNSDSNHSNREEPGADPWRFTDGSSEASTVMNTSDTGRGTRPAKLAPGGSNPGAKPVNAPEEEVERREKVQTSRMSGESLLPSRRSRTERARSVRRLRVPSLPIVFLVSFVLLGGILLWLARESPSPQRRANPAPSARPTSGLIHSFSGHTRRVEAVAWSSDGAWVLSGSENGELLLWDMQKRVLSHTFPVSPGGVWSVAFSEDSRLAVTGGLRNGIRVWNLQNRLFGRTLVEEPPTGVPGVAFAPDGRSVTTCSSPGSLRLWNAETGALIHTYGPDGKQRWSCVDVSRDGKYVVAGTEEGALHLYDRKTGTEIRTFSGHLKRIRRTAFSPNGRCIASCGFDSQVILWNTETGQEVRRFHGHPGWVEWVGFSPDGRTLLSTEGPIGHTNGVTLDHGIRFWDVSTGRQIHRYGDIPEKVHCAAFSPNGRQVVIGCGDTLVRLYEVGWITSRQP